MKVVVKPLCVDTRRQATLTDVDDKVPEGENMRNGEREIEEFENT